VAKGPLHGLLGLPLRKLLLVPLLQEALEIPQTLLQVRDGQTGRRRQRSESELAQFQRMQRYLSGNDGTDVCLWSSMLVSSRFGNAHSYYL
jgi:hypothetical protein